MVAASHPAISLAGARALARGGNAIDATLAMAAMSWLALPGQCGVGGDAFAVVREPDGTVWTVSGSGYGPDGATTDFYRASGYDAIPLDGALAVSVPGELAALRVLAGRATTGLADLWEPAAATAERGMPCTVKTRDDIAEHLEALRRDAGTARTLLPGGHLPAVGERLPNPDLAASIRAFARDPGSFYTGPFAEQAVATLRAAGAPFSGEEWQAGALAEAAPPITGRYGGCTVHETPLPTPGWMVLQQAALCDGVLAEEGLLGAAAVDRMARAARISFRDRWESGGSDSDAWRELLSDAAVTARRDRLARGELATPAGLSGNGDTTSTVAVDADGRAVSFIHSLAFTFGARVTVPGTGVVLNNRLGRGAYLVPGHPNEVRPRRKPMHTLNAWLVTDSAGRLQHVGNTPGGDGQVQWNMQLLSHLLDHGLDPQQTVSAPRFTVFPGSDADVVGEPPQLRCESRLAPDVREGLRALGHDVVAEGPWDAGGSALVLSVDHEHGVLVGGADPRQEGVVLGV
jgi:gamma-glutamyltranspeptidase/glutathione hydrolase